MPFYAPAELLMFINFNHAMLFFLFDHVLLFKPLLYAGEAAYRLSKMMEERNK